MNQTINTPGFISLLPVLGSAFLILASDNAIINRTLLSWKSMTFIGLISYSLYLWHWPLISYLHLATPAAPQWHYGAALLLAFPISIIVYVFIENPVRGKIPKNSNTSSDINGIMHCFRSSIKENRFRRSSNR